MQWFGHARATAGLLKSASWMKNLFYDCFQTFMENAEKECNIGLASGQSGAILCSDALYRDCGKDTFREIRDKLIDKEAGKVINRYDAGSGLAGFALTLKWCKLYKDVIGTQDAIVKKRLEMALLGYSAKSQLAYFEGAAGILLFFLQDAGMKEYDKLRVYCSFYSKCVKESLEKRSLYSPLNFKGEAVRCINLGTPHGLTGILLVLLMAYRATEMQEVKEAALETCRYIVSNMNRSGPWHIPCGITQSGRPLDSGIGWCYGDLTTAYALMQAGDTLGADDFKELGLRLMLSCKERIDKQKSNYKNLCLCHGLSSLFLIFKKTFELTQHPSLKCAYKEYKERFHALLEKKFASFIAGEEDADRSFFQDPSLFYGVCGCILCLSAGDAEEGSWQSALLL